MKNMLIYAFAIFLILLDISVGFFAVFGLISWGFYDGSFEYAVIMLLIFNITRLESTGRIFKALSK